MASFAARHEEPISMRIEEEGKSAILRGAIDCLVQRRDSTIAVLEFKTGHRRPIHQRQLDLYVEAAQHLFPGVAVEGHLLYLN
jgi:ATP-dependent exoDNAse (exonuclease V) beta subunit